MVTAEQTAKDLGATLLTKFAGSMMIDAVSGTARDPVEHRDREDD